MNDKFKNIIFLLDADGTITDLKTKRPNPILIEKLGSFLDQKGRISIITGRVLEWVEETILINLKKVSDSSKDITIVAEFGAVSKYKKEGNFVVEEEKRPLY